MIKFCRYAVGDEKMSERKYFMRTNKPYKHLSIQCTTSVSQAKSQSQMMWHNFPLQINCKFPELLPAIYMAMFLYSNFVYYYSTRFIKIVLIKIQYIVLFLSFVLISSNQICINAFLRDYSDWRKRVLKYIYAAYFNLSVVYREWFQKIQLPTPNTDLLILNLVFEANSELKWNTWDLAPKILTKVLKLFSTCPLAINTFLIDYKSWRITGVLEGNREVEKSMCRPSEWLWTRKVLFWMETFFLQEYNFALVLNFSGI